MVESGGPGRSKAGADGPVSPLTRAFRSGRPVLAAPAAINATHVSVGSLRDTGVFALAIVTGERSYEANPPADRVLRPGETLVVSGSVSRLRELRGTGTKG